MHSYGRLVHSQQVITRKDQLLLPGDIRGPGKIECTRTKQRAYFALHRTGIHRNAEQGLFYRNVRTDHERDTLMFRTSNMNRIKNTMGFCTIIDETFFYLFLLPGKYSQIESNILHITCKILLSYCFHRI